MNWGLFRFRLCLAFCSLILAGCGPAAFQVEIVPARQRLKETTIQQDAGLFVSDKIAVIDVDGMLVNRRKHGLMRIGENPVSMFVEKLDKAASDRKVKAVVLRINSPGGTVAASDVMYHSLKEFKRKTGKPIVACMLDLGCSGAYYLACGSDGIISQPGGVTGSIGTILQTFSVEGTMQKIGVKAVAIKSGELKDMGSPLHDLNEKEREVLEGIIMQFFDQFVTVVGKSRQKIESQKLRELADGRVFTAVQALQEGLIDRVGYPADGIEWAKEMAGVGKARVVMYHRPAAYKPNVYGSAVSAEDRGGALVNIEMPDWLNSGGAQFLYLWQPGIE